MENDTDEYVSIEVLLTFNKLKELTKDVALVAQAAQNSQLLALDASRTRIKRVTALPPSYRADPLTVYAELFPQPYTRETLEEIFSKCGQVNYISIPRNERVSQGYAFIEYETPEMAKEAVQKLNTINNPAHLPVAPKGMRVMSKDTWFRLKDEMKELKERLNEAKKVNNLAPEPGLIVFFGNVGPDINSKDIKLEMKQFGAISYIDYDPATRTGYARFRQPTGAKKACKDMMAAKFQLGGKEIICRVITGNEEQQYWKLIHSSAANKKHELYYAGNPDNHKDKNKNNYHNNNKNNYQNKTNNNSNNDSENMENNSNTPYQKKQPLKNSGGEGEEQKGQGDNSNNNNNFKKQKRQNKEIKVKGKKIPNIATTKPRSHVVFGDDGEAVEVEKKNPLAEKGKVGTKAGEGKEINEAGQESRKRAAAEEESNESKRAKVDQEEKSKE